MTYAQLPYKAVFHAGDPRDRFLKVGDRYAQPLPSGELEKFHAGAEVTMTHAGPERQK